MQNSAVLPRAGCNTADIPILEVKELCKWYGIGSSYRATREYLRSVDGISFKLQRGETLGLVGESGSGKTTLAKTIMRIVEPTSGRVMFDGNDISHLSRHRLLPIRSRMQMIFQDPVSSLNPSVTIEKILSLPYEVQRKSLSKRERNDRIDQILDLVGLGSRYRERFPHELSGGQRQRIGIARALATEPELLVADEPVSALDVSVQAQIVNLLMEMRDRLHFTMLFVSHDLAIVGHMCDRVAVMYLGRIVEIGSTRSIFARPRHPYTEALFDAIPSTNPEARKGQHVLGGERPSPISVTTGCPFKTRCRYALPGCATAMPALRKMGDGHYAACIRDDLALRAASF
ncbi:ABC transporter ATP-binding protein [Agrobacterium tumefaciens]|uniref:ABC transporter ATP-binding protein n=1 Tax=Agrobacterium tumefaciens TaxID=358 RepID=UPI001574BA59|nr:ABC transporter ATP-binding protein [Agrobacterium tumefaciens]